MKRLLILLLLVGTACGAQTQFGPFDPGAVRKTDYTADQVLKMDADGSNAAATVAFPGDADIGGDLTGVNASFSGAVEAGGVELMKNDGSNAETSVSLGFPQKEIVNLTAGNAVVTFSEVTIGSPDYFFVYVNGLFQSSLSGVSSNTVTLDSTLSEDSVIVGVKFD